MMFDGVFDNLLVISKFVVFSRVTCTNIKHSIDIDLILSFFFAYILLRVGLSTFFMRRLLSSRIITIVMAVLHVIEHVFVFLCNLFSCAYPDFGTCETVYTGTSLNGLMA